MTRLLSAPMLALLLAACQWQVVDPRPVPPLPYAIEPRVLPQSLVPTVTPTSEATP